jgi:hypothetical protein
MDSTKNIRDTFLFKEESRSIVDMLLYLSRKPPYLLYLYIDRSSNLLYLEHTYVRIYRKARYKC